MGVLTLALELEHGGIGCRLYEAEPAITAIWVGSKILPHAAKELGRLGLLEAVAVATDQAVLLNRFGQHTPSTTCGEGLPCGSQSCPGPAW